MKSIVTAVVAVVLLGSCSNDGNNEHADHQPNEPAVTTTEETRDIPKITPAFDHVDGAVSSHIKEVFEHYIHVKTALVNSNADEAKNGATAILEVLRNFDKSLLAAGQKSAYDKSIVGIKSAAGGIVSAGDLEQQRVHFAELSLRSYELAKSFGAGRKMYHEHCPMAFDDKGAMWLSESEDIRNPYFGEKMLQCGTVEEVIEN